VCRFLIAFAVLSAHVLAFQNVSRPGAIEGIVADDQGKPVSGVKVLCCRFTSSPVATKRVTPYAVTGQDGKFNVTNLMLGEDIVSTLKQEDGDPDRTRGLHGGFPLLRVTLDAEHPVAHNVVVELGPKAAIIAGSVLDVTGAPVSGNLQVWTVDKQGGRSESVKGTYLVLIPPDIPTQFLIRAAGYIDGYYPGVSDITGSSLLTLKSGDRKTINVRLVPKSQ
jgi:hypothetical protein